ncbi:MAG: hypothetical protein HY730_08350 [Candidatus Tectomicrobia bacterium]|uniref:N-terminal of MaoC-like dehydratase domain-containing protein n=1 Tax=Tectimicrobiota bacterium TaxID=2528274 RepID=A0A933LQP7_UNCTE|nr:hypothetical protein [Candidatus Tectomicrobia bacterium]
MNQKTLFESMQIGLDLGTWEITLDKDRIKERMRITQWQGAELIDGSDFAPPGTTIEIHPRMKFAKFPGLKAAIWAKSEHEFFKPMMVGSKVFIHGKVAGKYIKREKVYLVTEFEAVDENGEVLMISRETAVCVD